MVRTKKGYALPLLQSCQSICTYVSCHMEVRIKIRSCKDSHLRTALWLQHFTNKSNNKEEWRMGLGRKIFWPYHLHQPTSDTTQYYRYIHYTIHMYVLLEGPPFNDIRRNNWSSIGVALVAEVFSSVVTKTKKTCLCRIFSHATTSALIALWS